MMDGFLNILKPPGMTSSDVVVQVRRMLPRGAKVGHAGTLDPMAAGVLPLMVGKATRLFDVATAGEKEYIASLRMGLATDTQDATGNITERGSLRPDDATLAAVLLAFTGDIDQVPPAYSALKQDGVRLYELARRGALVQKPPRRVHIARLELLERLSPEEALLRVVCGKGTYIRALCHDIGERLGCHAHMGMLLRTRAGWFDIEQGHPLEDLGPEAIEGLLAPMDAPLSHLPAARASGPEAAHACRNGNPLRPAWFPGGVPEAEQALRIYLEEEFIGIGRRAGDVVRFDAMLKTWGNDEAGLE